MRGQVSEKPLKKQGASRRSRWKWRLKWGVVVLFVLYGASLLVLNSGWAKSKLTDKLESKSGLKWQLDKVLWVPFGNLELYGLHSELSSGGIELKSITLRPVWSQCLKGNPEFQQMAVDGVVLDIDQSYLEEILKKKKEAAPLIVSSQRPDPAPKKRPQPAIKPPVSQKKKTTAPPPPPQQRKQSVTPELGPTKWLKVTDATLRIRKGDHIYFEKQKSALLPY